MGQVLSHLVASGLGVFDSDKCQCCSLYLIDVAEQSASQSKAVLRKHPEDLQELAPRPLRPLQFGSLTKKRNGTFAPSNPIQKCPTNGKASIAFHCNLPAKYCSEKISQVCRAETKFGRLHFGFPALSSFNRTALPSRLNVKATDGG